MNTFVNNLKQLLAYSIVAACVLILKYEVDESDALDERVGAWSKLMNTQRVDTPTKYTSGLATLLVTLYSSLCLGMAFIISGLGSSILQGNPLSITLLCLVVGGIVISFVLLIRQPSSLKKLPFSVPFTPWTPALSIMINFYLMSELDVMTWIRFGVWIAIGLLIYFTYGRKYSKEKQRLLLTGNINEGFGKLN